MNSNIRRSQRLMSKQELKASLLDEIVVVESDDESDIGQEIPAKRANTTVSEVILINSDEETDEVPVDKSAPGDEKGSDQENIPVNQQLVRKTEPSCSEGINLQRGEILKYPSGPGAFSLTAADFKTLATGVYLNDIILDFYMKYLTLEILSERQRDQTLIFGSFFYSQLKSPPSQHYVKQSHFSKLTAAQKRHFIVKNWTKNDNLFEKDFIIVPINDHSHWFLAVICFPYLDSPRMIETDQAIAVNSDTGTQTTGKVGAKLKGREELVDEGQAIQRPCILIFDSVYGLNRSEVVVNLREYLTCEFKEKFPQKPAKIFTKNNMVGHYVNVPKQQNGTDCGLFVLQFAENFFTNPITNYRIPIESLGNWFDQMVVTRKREDIANLIKDLIKRSHPNEAIELPKIQLPTKNGKLSKTGQSVEVFEELPRDDHEVEESLEM